MEKERKLQFPGRYAVAAVAAIHVLTGGIMLIAVPAIGCSLETVDCKRRFMSLSLLSKAGISQSLFVISCAAFLCTTLVMQQFANGFFGTGWGRGGMAVLSWAACLCTAVFLCFPLEVADSRTVKGLGNMMHYIFTILAFGLLQTWVLGFGFASPLAVSASEREPWRLAVWLRGISIINLFVAVGIGGCLNTNQCFLATEILFLALLYVQHGLIFRLLLVHGGVNKTFKYQQF